MGTARRALVWARSRSSVALANIAQLKPLSAAALSPEAPAPQPTLLRFNGYIIMRCVIVYFVRGLAR